MASFKEEGSTEPRHHLDSGPATPEEPSRRAETADPYEATAERLFVLLEENQAGRNRNPRASMAAHETRPRADPSRTLTHRRRSRCRKAESPQVRVSPRA
jgi:hypothetical protein